MILVFTNGCFDILHVGHIRLLQWAKSQGDYLIVGVNSDASIQRIKGESRPINPLAYRIEMLNAIKWVDEVIPFTEDTPENLIRGIRPNILVKGSDYQNKCVVGSQYAGEVRFFPIIEGVSTTLISERLKNEAHS